MEINVGDGVNIDAQKMLTGRCCIIGQSGSGKSYLVGVITEELARNHLPFVIIDTEGEYNSLRSAFSMLWVGGAGADLPLGIDYGKLIQRSLSNRIPIIFDVSEEIDKDKKVDAFLDALYSIEDKLRSPYLVIVEEADKFCLSADTEILSRAGWKTYKEIGVGDEALTMDVKSGLLEYKHIQRVIIKKHKGMLNRIKTRTGLDSLTTIEHRHLLQPFDHGKHGPWHWKPFEFRQLNQCPTAFRIPVAGQFKGTKKMKLSKQFLRLLGWIITDGNWNDAGKRAIAITQSKPEGIKKIKALLDFLGFKYTYSTRKKLRSHKIGDGRVIKDVYPSSRFYISAKDTLRIKETLGENIHRIPRAILDSDALSLRHLYEGMIDGDGTRGRYKTRVSGQERVRTNCLYCMKEDLADDFQELCTKIGIRSRKTNTRIFISERYPWHHIKATNISESYYDGVVWDISIPNGNFVARRKGAVFITGNCPQVMHTEINMIEEISVRGRKRGIGLIVATQRPANINKNVLAQCSYGFIGKLTIENDLGAVNILFDNKNDLSTVPTLKTGEFIGFGFDKNVRFKVKQRVVKHGGSTPILKESADESEDIDSIISELKGNRGAITSEKGVARSKGGGPNSKAMVIVEKISADFARDYANKAERKKFIVFGDPVEVVESISERYIPLNLTKLSIPTGRKNEFEERYAAIDGKLSLITFDGRIKRSEALVSKKLRLSDPEKKLLSLINGRKESDLDKFSKQTGLSEGKIYDAIDRFEKAGLITMDKDRIHVPDRKRYISKAIPDLEERELESGDIAGAKAQDGEIKAALELAFPSSTTSDTKVVYLPFYQIKLRKGDKIRVFRIDALFGKEMVAE